MRIVQITPGAGEGYDCENCLRDTSLTWALKQAGHDTRMVPLYLPPIADRPEEQVDSEIFYGGINVYLQQKTRVFRKTPRWVDRMLDRPALLSWAARRSGMTSPEELGQTTMSMLRGGEGHQKKELTRLLAHLGELERPDLVCLSNILLAGLAGPIKRALGVPVVCQLQDEDGFLDDLGGELAEQAWELVVERARDLDGFIASSRYFAALMRDRAVLTQPIEVVHGAIHPDDFRPAPHPLNPPTVGFIAPLLPRSGLDQLVEAWARVRETLPVELIIAGSRGPADKAFCRSVMERIEALELARNVTWVSGVDREARIDVMQRLTMLCVPTRRGEAFGRFSLEALAAGVPLVLPAHGGFVEVVEETGGGLLVPPNDVDGLTAALAALAADSDRVQSLGRAGREAVAHRFNLGCAADALSSAFETLLAGVGR